MHRKSLEAAEHLKEQENCNSNSDHEDTTSTRTQASDTSSNNNNNPQQTQHDKDPQHSQPYPADDPEAFRNNSIACLRAKAQEHSAKLMIRAQQDANANNLQQQHHQEVVEAGGGGVF